MRSFLLIHAAMRTRTYTAHTYNLRAVIKFIFVSYIYTLRPVVLFTAMYREINNLSV